MFYEKLGFRFGEPWERFNAIGQTEGLELHLEETPKHDGASFGGRPAASH